MTDTPENIRLTFPVLSQLARDFEADARNMRERADQLSPLVADTKNPASMKARQLQHHLRGAAHHAEEAAKSYRMAAKYTEELQDLNVVLGGKEYVPEPWAVLNADELRRAEGQFVWKGKHPIPVIGETIRVILNGIGPGIVTGYFLTPDTDHEDTGKRFLGLRVQLTDPPAFYRKQCPDYATNPGHFYGTEVAPLG